MAPHLGRRAWAPHAPQASSRVSRSIQAGAAFQLHHKPQSAPLPGVAGGRFPAFPRALSSGSGKSSCSQTRCPHLTASTGPARVLGPAVEVPWGESQGPCRVGSGRAGPLGTGDGQRWHPAVARCFPSIISDPGHRGSDRESTCPRPRSWEATGGERDLKLLSGGDRKEGRAQMWGRPPLDRQQRGPAAGSPHPDRGGGRPSLGPRCRSRRPFLPGG